jgi:hypothetical protein
MSFFAQLLILIPFLYVSHVYGEKNQRGIVTRKSKKHERFYTLFLIVLFISLLFTYIIYPFQTLVVWFIYSLFFPLFFLIQKWGKLTRDIYDKLSVSQISTGFMVMFQPGVILEELCNYLGFGFREETIEYCCDREGDSSTRDYFYVTTGNFKLDDILSNYFHFILIGVSILFIFYIVEIDKRIRDMIREIDAIDGEVRNNQSPQ